MLVARLRRIVVPLDVHAAGHVADEVALGQACAGVSVARTRARHVQHAYVDRNAGAHALRDDAELELREDALALHDRVRGDAQFEVDCDVRDPQPLLRVALDCHRRFGGDRARSLPNLRIANSRLAARQLATAAASRREGSVGIGS